MTSNPMKVAVVCGDGVPASGLLTVLRTVVDLGIAEGLVAPRVPADLGFAWRPDKPRFYPRGVDRAGYPPWLDVGESLPMPDAALLATRLIAIRTDIARFADLSDQRRQAVRAEIEELAAPFEEYFRTWLAAHDVDWLFAINMTLSDAAPVATALHRAARHRWGSGRPGGIMFWDHDLYGTCTVYENGERVYPLTPNELTPLPGDLPWTRWSVVSTALVKEAASYGTGRVPQYLPNPLPDLGSLRLTPRHNEFLAQLGIATGRPVLLAPVRIFRPKGIEITLALQQAMCVLSRERGLSEPCLLVFGRLDEDPAYAAELAACASLRRLSGDVRFLDGVPLGTWRDDAGRWHLDEVDLLRIAAGTKGAVVFTPSQPDLESVGLGPALAAIAGVPCAVTHYDAFDDVYGPDFAAVRIGPLDLDGLSLGVDPVLRVAAGELVTQMWTTSSAATNRSIVAERFPSRPWRAALKSMWADIHTSTPRPRQGIDDRAT
jgi:hypothetical protein